MPEQTRADHHHRADDELDVDAGIFRRLAVAADHVNVAAEARVGEHEVRDEQHRRGDDDDPRDAGDAARAERRDERRHGIGDLSAHQHRRDAVADLHHGERHDEGGDADQRHAGGVDRGRARSRRASAKITAKPAGQRHVGDVHVGFLQREPGDDDAGDVGDRRDRKVDLRAEDHEGQADRDDRGDRHLVQDVEEVRGGQERRARRAEEDHQAEQRREGRDVAELALEPEPEAAPLERRSDIETARVAATPNHSSSCPD